MARITAAMCARGRTLAEPRLAPSGDRVAFVAGRSGRNDLVVVPAEGGPELVLTAEPVASAHPFGGGVHDWLPSGDALVVVGRGGRLTRVAVEGGAPAVLVDGGDAGCPAVSPDGRRVAYVVDTRDVAIAPAEPGGRWPVRVSSGANDFALDPVWSPDGRFLAWLEWDVPAMPWDASRIVVLEVDRGERRVVAGGDGVAVQQPRFSPDGRLGFLSDATGFLNLWVVSPDGSGARPVVEEAFEHGEPTWGPGQRSWAWSPDGERAVFCRNEAGFGRLCVVDVAGGEVRELAKGVHGGLSWGRPGIVALRSGARTPDEVVLHDPERPGGDGRSVLAVGPVAAPRAALVEPEVVSWPGDDGAEIPGRLFRAAGDAPAPLLVWVHGGPTGQSRVTYDPRVAYFVGRGWSVLVPDHRGSTGWGRSFVQAMAGRWGELDVDDTAAGMRAAAERGWADPRRIVPIGSSAGGFTVLGLLARHPELCAAGVDLYGVADLFDLDESTHRFEGHYLHSLVGPLPDRAAAYRARSPVNFAGAIRAPLLVLQGTADTVVACRQSETLAERIRDAGGTVELHLYEGEGHGWSRPETVEDSLGRIEDFLRRHVLRWRE